MANNKAVLHPGFSFGFTSSLFLLSMYLLKLDPKILQRSESILKIVVAYTPLMGLSMLKDHIEYMP